MQHFCTILILFLVASLSLQAQKEHAPNKIDPSLWAKLANGESAEMLVIMKEQANLDHADEIWDKNEKGQYVYETLLAVSERTQPNVRRLLRESGAPVNTFWIINGLWTQGNAELALELANLPEVDHIEDNPVWKSSLPKEAPAEDFVQDRTLIPVSWGLTMVNADDVWAMNYKGAGVVVGGQDTGYEWKHPAIKEKYRGWNGTTANHNYNWHDAIRVLINGGVNSCGLNLSAPCDDNAHGTHTVGTMTGGVDDNNIIGVAPEAKWIGCRNMEEGDGRPSTYIECFQWFVMPTDLAGNNPDVTKSPHVINNSWGCPTSEQCTTSNFGTMDTVVNNVRSAGILVVVSAGNDGPNCSTVNTPAAIFQSSFTVGATNNSNAITNFSSKGPVVNFGTRIKPNISAPGQAIYSCIGYDTLASSYSYASYNGTSMAGPHVAGVAALVMCANPQLKGQVATLENLLQNSALALYDTAPFCGSDNATSRPNNVFGYGRVDALAAVTAALALPVELLHFTAKERNEQAVLYWATASELDCDRFEVQRSTNGYDWEVLGDRACSVQSSTEQQYSFTDPTPSKGINYYRLRQVDRSGEATFSAIASLYFKTGVRFRAIVQSAAHSLVIEVTEAGVEEDLVLDIYAADGRWIQQNNIGLSSTVFTPNLQAGIYMLALRNREGQLLGTEKVVWR